MYWNDITDKPFGEETLEPITWDGNVEGLVTTHRGSLTYAKVSDNPLTKEELLGATITLRDIDSDEIL